MKFVIPELKKKEKKKKKTEMGVQNAPTKLAKLKIGMQRKVQ
jgi:hypothetical protein